jgi:hypothetical protein
LQTELEKAFDKFTADQVDVWKEIYKLNPSAQSAITGNPFFKALKKEMESKTIYWDKILRKAPMDKVASLQGIIAAYEHLTGLFEKIEKINVENKK